MTTTLAFALRPALPTDVDFEHFLYASTRDDLRPLGPEVFDGLVGMQFRAQTMSIRLDHPQADRKIVVVEDAPAGRLIVDESGDHPAVRRDGAGAAEAVMLEGGHRSGVRIDPPGRLFATRLVGP